MTRPVQMFRAAMVCIAVTVIGGPASAGMSQISQREAMALVDSAVTMRLRHPVLQPFDGNDARFYFFEQINPNAAPPAHVMSFAVNKWSGDVWTVDGGCRHLFPKNTDLQVARFRPPRNLLPSQCGVAH